MTTSVEWIKQFGDINKQYNLEAISINDQGEIFVAGSISKYRHYDPEKSLVAKITRNGEMVWTKENLMSSGEYILDIHASSDGGAIALQNSTLIKYSAGGEIEWKHAINIQGFSGGKIVADSIGNLYIKGEVHDHSQKRSTNIILLKYDLQGNHVWSVTKSATEAYTNNVRIYNDVIYLTGMASGSLDGQVIQTQNSAFSIAINQFGESIFTRLMPLQQLFSAEYEAFSPTDSLNDSLGNIYISGILSLSHPMIPILVKLNQDGQLIWTKSLDEFSFYDEPYTGYNLYLVNEDNIVVAGIYQNPLVFGEVIGANDIGISIYDKDGNKVGITMLGTRYNESFSDIAEGLDGNIIAIGSTDGNLGGDLTLGTQDALVANIVISEKSTPPEGKPLLRGIFRDGESINISADGIQDADNYVGFIPQFAYEWEASSDNGKSWIQIKTIDAMDGNISYTLTSDDAGKLIRGVTLFNDGKGNSEILKTAIAYVDYKPTLTQSVQSDYLHYSFLPSSVVTIPLQYTTSTGDSQLSGLTLNIHYNSSILTPTTTNNGVSDQLPVSITTNKIVPDTNNLDNDPLTDKIIQLIWATFDNTFPNKTLPTTLANLTFNTSSATTDPVTGAPITTSLRYTASDTAAGYDFLTNYTTLKATSFNLDVDGDGQVKPLTDGLMIIRKLLGPAFDGDALTFKAIGSGATRTTAEIHDFIQGGIDGGMLDVDKNGKTAPLTDGLMVIRRLLGPAFDGDALTFKALASDSPYFGKTDAPALVSANIDALRSF